MARLASLDILFALALYCIQRCRAVHRPEEAYSVLDNLLCNVDDGKAYVNLRPCWSSYFSFASSATMRFPSSTRAGSLLAAVERCTSSIACVCMHVRAIVAPKGVSIRSYDDDWPSLSG